MATANTTNAPSDNTKKRKATDTLTMSDEDEVDPAFPHFLVVESTTQEPIRHSIFAIQKILQCALCRWHSQKRQEIEKWMRFNRGPIEGPSQQRNVYAELD